MNLNIINIMKMHFLVKNYWNFKPDIVYVYSTIKNIKTFPSIVPEQKQNEDIFTFETKKLETIWENLFSKLACVVFKITLNFHKLE